jgi:DNA-binding transcriptional LysR family regulator
MSLAPDRSIVQSIVRCDQDAVDRNPRLELCHLRYFVAVVEELHFGRAALKLNFAQPPLAQQIRHLEEILGYALFVRTSRSVNLTAAGAVYLERTRKALQTITRDIDEMRKVASGEVGSLYIGFVGSAMLTRLPSILRAPYLVVIPILLSSRRDLLLSLPSSPQSKRSLP